MKFIGEMSFFVIAVTVVLLVWGLNHMQESNRILKFGSAGAWFNLEPGMQHSLYADKLLSNQFQALVGSNDSGEIVPLAAKSWQISSDGKKITFKIDPTKKFSDGSSLVASDFKNSWEDALRQSPESTNNSLLDVLYKIEGFESFQKVGSISGIKTLDDETLEIQFTSNFRFALDHFQGSRFAAYKRDQQGNFLGTGCYTISEIGQNKVVLRPNKYNLECKELQSIELSVLDPQQAVDKIKSDELDGIVYSFSSHYDSIPDDKEVTVLSGYDANHEVIIVNGRSGRLFSNAKFRLAFQSLIAKKLYSESFKMVDPRLVRMDMQVYLPFQSGRLDDISLRNAIQRGEIYEKEFLEYAHKNAPVVKYSFGRKWILDLIIKAGIPVSEKSRSIDKEAMRDLYYKTNDADLIPFGFSVVGADPDNIYHALGKSGAITSNMIVRPETQKLLEQGREIVESNLVDKFYKGVNLEIISEVPFVHLGFSRHIALLSSRRIQTKEKYVRRNFGHLNIYESK